MYTHIFVLVLSVAFRCHGAGDRLQADRADVRRRSLVGFRGARQHLKSGYQDDDVVVILG